MKIPVKAAKCNRCGDPGVAWVKSRRTGKAYLAQAYSVDGDLVADTRHFHKCEDFRAKTTERKPQAAAALLNGSASLDELPDAAGTSVQRQEPEIQTRLEFALKTALHAAKAAEKYATEIGHPIQFDKADIRLLAQTLLINGFRERAA